jgi:parallel beta-helix repeat protein
LEVLEGGRVEIGTVQNPITAKINITFRDIPINTSIDPAQYGNSLLGFGIIKMHGKLINETFVRVKKVLQAGDQTIELESAVNWEIGDIVYIPTSSQHAINTKAYVPEYEERTITKISSDMKIITLNQPLKYTHPGAVDGSGNLQFLPHVALLSRNLIIQSENPNGARGITLFGERADIDIRYAKFYNLGRTTNYPLDSTEFDSSGNPTHIGTNQIARYPLHAHHLAGPTSPQLNGYQFTIIGNSIDGGTDTNEKYKWGITIHESHYGLIENNIIHNYAGAGMALEDGSETKNLIKRKKHNK